MNEQLHNFMDKWFQENKINLLLWGLSGAGKSMLAALFPRFGRKLHVDVFDPSGVTLYKRLVPSDELVINYWPVEGSLALASHGRRKGKGGKETLPIVDKEAPSTEGRVWIPWADSFQARFRDGSFKRDVCAGYICDSVSFFSRAAIERQLFLAGKPGSIPDVDAGDYDALKHGQVRAFAMMASIPCSTVFVAHEVIKADWGNPGGAPLHELNVSGSARAELPAMCKEVYHVSGETLGVKTKYHVRTAPMGNLLQNKTEMGLFGRLKPKEEVTIDTSKPIGTQGLYQLWAKALKPEMEENK